jgi:hypothetical protein
MSGRNRTRYFMRNTRAVFFIVTVALAALSGFLSPRSYGFGLVSNVSIAGGFRPGYLPSLSTNYVGYIRWNPELGRLEVLQQGVSATAWVELGGGAASGSAGGPYFDYWLSYVFHPLYSSAPFLTTTSTLASGEATYVTKKYTGSSGYVLEPVEVFPVDSFGPDTILLEIDNPAIGTAGPDNSVLYVGPGTAVVTVTYYESYVSSQELVFNATLDRTNTIILSGATNFLRGSVLSNLLVAAAGPGTNLHYLLSAGKPYAYNPDSWAAEFDVRCVSPWNSANGMRKKGVLLTSNIVYQAAHYYSPVGTELIFIAADNTVYTTTVAQVLAGPAIFSPDVALLRVDPPLPSDIPPAQIITSPELFGLVPSRFPVLQSVYDPLGSSALAVSPMSLLLPAININQRGEAQVGLLSGPGTFVVGSTAHPEFRSRTIGIVSGDSGGPVLIPFKDMPPIFMFGFTGGGGLSTWAYGERDNSAWLDVRPYVYMGGGYPFGDYFDRPYVVTFLEALGSGAGKLTFFMDNNPFDFP